MVYTRLTLKGFVDPNKPKGRQILKIGYIGALFDGWEHEVCFWFERSLGKLIEKTNMIIIEGDLSFKKANILGDVLQFSEEKVKVHFDSIIKEIEVYAVGTTHREGFDRIRRWDDSVELTEEEKRSKAKVERMQAQAEKNVAAKKKERIADVKKSARKIRGKMLNNDFWHIIDKSKHMSKAKKDHHAEQYELIVKELQQLSAAEIFKFYYIFQKKYEQAAHDGFLLPICFIINGGIVSQQKYNEFVGWVIAQGRVVYENILRNPDYISSVLEYKKPFPILGPNYDIYSLVIPLAAVNTYEQVHGSNFTNEEYAALEYSQKFNDSLKDAKGPNIARLMEPDLSLWANSPNRDKIAKSYPKTFEKFGKWMVDLFGDFQPMTPENQATFKKLVKEQVEEWENDPSEPPVVSKTFLISTEVQCSYCKKFVDERKHVCPHCQNSLKR